MRRLFVGAVLLCILGTPAFGQQLSSEVTPIDEDARCKGVLVGITNDEMALSTGCARFWPQWPAEKDPDQAQKEKRIYQLQGAWNIAQRNGFGHYAVLTLGPARADAQNAPTSNIANATPGMDGIRPKCAKEWPDDFRMRAYCERQQQEAAVKLSGRTMGAGDRLTIRTKCAGEWPGDYRMMNYCEERQLEALASLR